jgi:hypothetical protein
LLSDSIARKEIKSQKWGVNHFVAVENAVMWSKIE